MRLILALLLLAAPALAQPGDIAHQILFAMAARPDAEPWLEQQKFTPQDAQQLLRAARRNNIVALQNELSPTGREALSNLLAAIRLRATPHPTHWAYVTHINLPHPAMTIIGIAIPTSADPMPTLRLKATSPSGRTTTKELKPTRSVSVLSFDFPYCNDDHTLCEDGVFPYSFTP
jgi:hypothetical protein